MSENLLKSKEELLNQDIPGNCKKTKGKYYIQFLNILKYSKIFDNNYSYYIINYNYNIRLAYLSKWVLHFRLVYIYIIW